MNVEWDAIEKEYCIINLPGMPANTHEFKEVFAQICNFDMDEATGDVEITAAKDSHEYRTRIPAAAINWLADQYNMVYNATENKETNNELPYWYKKLNPSRSHDDAMNIATIVIKLIQRDHRLKFTEPKNNVMQVKIYTDEFIDKYMTDTNEECILAEEALRHEEQLWQKYDRDIQWHVLYGVD